MKVIKDIMTSKSLTCRGDEMIDGLADKLFLSDADVLSVVDENKKLMGVITHFDLSAASDGKNKSKGGLRAYQVMNPATPMVNTHDDEALALNLMRSNHLNKLPVVDKDNFLQGTVSFMSVARSLIQSKNEIKKTMSIH